MIGIYFSIEEFSTFDGPGIRTTVFLKGCPLSCIWCHNPEGQEKFPQQITLNNGKTDICGKEITTSALCEKLLKNADFLNSSGGGVTFSGGEPLYQADFLLACLKALKGKLHRAIQTTGFSSTDTFKKIINNCDYMLYDFKLADSKSHKQYTGVDNELIIKNLEILKNSGVPFTVRIPLIPTITDTEDNITSTAKILHNLNINYAELLPYNKMAGGKYAMLGRKYCPDFDERIPPNARTKIFEKFNIEVQLL